MDQLAPGSQVAATSAPPVAVVAAAGQPPPRTKSKAYQTTIAAEAGEQLLPHHTRCSGFMLINFTPDDLKYESKYKELKKKVKEVEEVRFNDWPDSWQGTV
jgi:hypothetical protein